MYYIIISLYPYCWVDDHLYEINQYKRLAVKNKEILLVPFIAVGISIYNIYIYIYTCLWLDDHGREWSPNYSAIVWNDLYSSAQHVNKGSNQAFWSEPLMLFIGSLEQETSGKPLLESVTAYLAGLFCFEDTKSRCFVPRLLKVSKTVFYVFMCSWIFLIPNTWSLFYPLQN